MTGAPTTAPAPAPAAAPTWEALSKEARLMLVAPLAAKNMSASQIANEVGATRNAIVGFCNRNRDKVQLSGATRKQAEKARRALAAGGSASTPTPRPVKRALRLAAAHRNGVWLPLPGTMPVHILDHVEGQCRWPVGDDDDGAKQMYCGCVVVKRGSYCEHHGSLEFRGGVV